MPSYLGVPLSRAIIKAADCFILCVNDYEIIKHHFLTEPSFDDVQRHILKEEDAAWASPSL